jgi:gas vesicle protein
MIYTHVAAALLGAVIAATAAWQVQDWRWSGKVDRIEKHHAEQLQRAEALARSREQAMQTNAERIASELDKTNTRLADQSVAATRTVRGLRDEVARLNARPAPACPEAATIFVEASTARDLLATCADEYRAVAADADRLSAQVTGLQDWASNVCKSP